MRDIVDHVRTYVSVKTSHVISLGCIVFADGGHDISPSISTVDTEHGARWPLLRLGDNNIYSDFAHVTWSFCPARNVMTFHPLGIHAMPPAARW